MPFNVVKISCFNAAVISGIFGPKDYVRSIRFPNHDEEAGVPMLRQ